MLKKSSFQFAFKGLLWAIRNERHIQFHLLATIIVIGAGVLLSVTTTDWFFLSIAIALVWIAELLNTAIEQACNAITTEFKKEIQIAKDVAAASALVASCIAACIGGFVFYPYISQIIEF